MRLGDLDALHDHVMEEMRRNPHNGYIERMMHRHEHESFLRDIRRDPTVDAVPVVRCKDCKHSRGLNEKERLCVCDDALICKNSEAHVDGWNPMWPDDFCSYGERKEADGNDE